MEELFESTVQLDCSINDWVTKDFFCEHLMADENYLSSILLTHDRVASIFNFCACRLYGALLKTKYLATA